MESLEDNFCVIPWLQSTVQTNGKVRACCQMIFEPYGFLQDEQGVDISASNSGYEASKNAPLLKKLRKQMMNGEKPTECELCWREESVGLFSKRNNFNRRYDSSFEELVAKTKQDGSLSDDSELRHVDFRLGNKCNLKCRYCGPSDSSGWYSDFVALNRDTNSTSDEDLPYKHFNRTDYLFKKDKSGWSIDTQDFEWYEDSEFLRELKKNLKNIDGFYFAGGEPTLIAAHWSLLEACIELGYSQLISLDYNTNATFIKPEHFEIWKKFKSVTLGFSIDGIQEVTPYLRPPVKWKTIERNLELLNAQKNADGIHSHVSITVSVLNILHCLDVARYFLEKDYKKVNSEIFIHFVTHPSHFNPQILSREAKAIVSQKYDEFYVEVLEKYGKEKLLLMRNTFQAVTRHLEEADHSELIHTFYQQTEKLDNIRNQSFSDTLPEIHKLLLLK